MAASAPDSAAHEDTGTYRRRLLVATALSLLLHLLIAGGLATTHLGILSLPANDGSATATNIFKPKLAADFPLEVPKSGSAAAAHEKPLDLGTPKQRSDAPKAAARRDRAISRQESRETEEKAAVSKRLPDRPARPREAAAPPAAAAAVKRNVATKAPAAAATAELPTIKPAEAARELAAAKPSAARPQRPPSARAATTAASEMPREVALLSKTRPKTSGGSEAMKDTPPRDRSATDTAPRNGPMIRRDVAAASAGETAATVAPLATTPAATSTATAQFAPAAIIPAASARSRGDTQGGAASAFAGGPRTAVAGADDAADGDSLAESADSSIAAGARVGGGARPARDDAAGGSADGGGLSAGLPPASPGRSALAGIGAAEADESAGDPAASVAGIEGLADGLADGRGNATGDGNTPGGSDGLPAPAPRRGGLGGSAAGRSAVSTSIAVETDVDGLSTEGLSVGPAGDLAAVVGGSRPAAEDTAAVPVIEQTALPRVAATLLPTDGRVREIAEPFANRAPDKRKATDADGIVDRGLLFLSRAQQADGRWSLNAYPGAADETAPKLASDTAATGLALLSFLGAGHDHFGGRHRDTVRRGLEFLLAAQKDDGDLYVTADPLSNSCGWLYSHGIAAMALCEAVGMTGDELVRPAAERACSFISASQHPERGGWRYTPRSDADLSVSGWMLVALRSGQLAGVAVEPRTLDGVRRLLDASTPNAGPTTRYLYNARKPDQRPSELSSSCMTAIGTLMRMHTGWRKDDPRVVEAGRVLAAMRPAYGTKEQKIRDCYLWYYMSQVLVHTGGDQWDSWYAALSGQLAATQQNSGAAAGSWDPLGTTPDRWGPYGGRIYVTTLHLLSLEVPYRHLPTYSIATEHR